MLLYSFIFVYREYENLQIMTLHTLCIVLTDQIENLAKKSHYIMQLRTTIFETEPHLIWTTTIIGVARRGPGIMLPHIFSPYSNFVL